ncbi:hypothetical protein [Psychrilyobacter atlanticus]|uniref:hypothetical protein n=1 Tax=Psychrilyobacter atlanticus TaxID=271091 RepID=UPI000414B06C|nr:hypothetical protein [Psychrilyobacter atlanticus]
MENENHVLKIKEKVADHIDGRFISNVIEGEYIYTLKYCKLDKAKFGYKFMLMLFKTSYDGEKFVNEGCVDNILIGFDKVYMTDLRNKKVREIYLSLFEKINRMKKELAEEKKIIWKEIVPTIKADIINMKHDLKNM